MSDEIISRFAEAADTLRRIPFPKGGKPPDLRAIWPDTVDDWWIAYARHEPIERLAAAQPGAIRRMDQTLHWLFWLTKDERKVVWARACGFSWRKIAALMGRPHMTVERRHERAIHTIRERLK
jgi:hypothetical protein